ncbi:MAG TPA: PQQ-binding-like beta-propeller repeat protein [Pirellulales bacterium]|jgi:outer membrane protein assembly factor BamB|nr:PQQ-binding-like beta-propeller repeat protein [Pirellulales bacterium]
MILRNSWPVVGRILSSFFCGLALLAPAASAAEPDPLDWPNWRGPEQNGISRETGIIDSWDPNAEGADGNVLWKNDELGGISTPIVLRGKLYTIVRADPDTPKEGEKVICVDAATGKKIWENKFNVFLSDVPAERVGWSSCVADPTTGNIYAMGVCNYLQCMDGETGKTLWKHSLNEEYGMLNTYGGRTNVPVLHEDLLIISGVIIGWGDMARPAHRFLAFDKKTGENVWFNGTRPLPEDTTYSTPFVTTLAGQAALVFASGDGGVYAWQPRTGKPIWGFQLSRRGINVSPVVEGDKVYASHAEENLDNSTMGAIVGINGAAKPDKPRPDDPTRTPDITNKGELFRVSAMDGKSSPLLVDGRLYAFDDGAKLYVVDVATGKQVGKPVKMIGTIMRSSPVYADGKIFACTTSAWHVFKPTKDGVKLTHKLRLAAQDEVTGSPIVSHGRIYLPTGARMYCLGKAGTKPAADPRPELAKETPRASEDEPAQVQVIPAESLLKPGQHQKFTVRLFNSRGQFLRNTNASFTLTGPGEITKEGNFLAASNSAHTATILTVKVGDLQSQARIRVVPDLPWKFDFSEGDVPITWVGARYRHVVRDLDGDKVMVKLTTIPKGQRSQAIMGPNDLHDYTVQADVRGAYTNNILPDAGVIAQRYTFDMMGAKQQLQIRSWTSQSGRFSKTVPFAWEPNTWYTLKFRAATDNGKAVLKGKAWKRGEPEPSQWNVEAVDEAPNLAGSPGLWGNAQVSEISIDNISVTKNTP